MDRPVVDDEAKSLSLRGSNQSGMRDHNERLVLTLLRNGGPMAKADIARATGLSAQTVSIIMRALEIEGMIARGKPIRGRIGQPSVPMKLDPDGAWFFGLKIGRRSLELALVDFVGILRHRITRTHACPTPDATIEFASDAVASMLRGLSEAERARVVGLGVALPFQLWDWASALGVPAERMAPWRDRDVAAELEAILRIPVFLQNDTSCACGAELVFGDTSRPGSFLYFHIAYFVGGGLVLDDTLFTGPTGNAAALGSMPVRRRDGGPAQLLELASLSVLERMLIDAGRPVDFLWTSPEDWAAAGTALEGWVQGCADGLAQAVLAASAVVDVPAVLIDGWLPSALRARLVDLTEARIAGLNFAGLQRPVIREGTLGPDARVLGAASLPLSDRFLVDQKAATRRSQPSSPPA